MELKNKEIKKLFDYVAPYFDLFSLPSTMTEFMACDEAIEGEIAAIKAELTDAKKGRAIFRSDADHLRVEVLEKGNELRKANNQIESLKKMIDELKEKLNIERKHVEEVADVNGQLASENADLKARLTFWEHSRITWRSRAQHAEKEVEDLNKKIHGLEEENANLRVTPFDTLEALKKENSELRNGNKALSAMCESRLSAMFEARKNSEQYKKSFMEYYEENDRLRRVVDILEKEINTLKKKIHDLEEENIHKRPWHGDTNAMTGGRTCCEFQNKEHNEKVDLSYGHEFKFGDKVYVPWSDAPYMYIKTSMMYNTRTKSLVYVGKTQHLKWFGERFEIK